MRVFWILLVLLLVIGQLITLFRGHSRIPVSQYPAVDGVPGLDELAGEIRSVWKASLRDPDTIRLEPVKNLSSGLLVRGELLLTLRDMEQILGESGCETGISGQLADWLPATGQNGPTGIMDYLAGIKGWLDVLAGSGEQVSPERSVLYPEAGSDYPCLSFELRGHPLELGRVVLEHETRFPGWYLKELDMVHEGGATPWWLRGSFVFTGESR